MDANTAAPAGGEAVDSRTSAGDPFMKLPVELQKAILDDLDDRRDVYAISHASPIMAMHGILEQILETELGPAQLCALLPDALAAVMFPDVHQHPQDAAKKSAITLHLQDWKSGRLLREHASAADKAAAYAFINRLAIPFAEDFAAVAGVIDGDQIRLPAWAHPLRSGRVRPPAAEIWRYEPEERVRLLRAFCRFELLSAVVRARPGAQLWTLAEQRRLLNTFFEAWEVEEVLCVQMYVGEMHTVLFETHVVDVLETLTTVSVISRLLDNERDGPFVRVRRGPFEDYQQADEDDYDYYYDENDDNEMDDGDDESHAESAGGSQLTVELIESIQPASPAQDDSEGSDAADTDSSSEILSPSSYFDSDDADSLADDETQWFTKTGYEANPGTPCAKFELAGREKHSVFVKQTATFGLAFLKHWIRSDAGEYGAWIRAHGHVLLDGMAGPHDAEYFGPFGARGGGGGSGGGAVPWLAFRLLDPTQIDGDNATANPPRTNADLAYGRAPGVDADAADAAANTAWLHIDATNPQLREAFRRCGWVFWSDARLRRSVFWNRRLDVFSPDAAPAWLYRPNSGAAAAADDDDYEYFRTRFQIRPDMALAIGGAAFLLGLSSAAEVKLLSFLAENRLRQGRALFLENPFDCLRCERIPLRAWEQAVGGADPAVPAGAVEVFDGIFWGQG
ncbi:hypothetical protein LX36DRAFT_752425 [Colletotrichum falcatum]|nr:hypothetical protein LX36DRAFT_752425 [Colletotrichum falcatum]